MVMSVLGVMKMRSSYTQNQKAYYGTLSNNITKSKGYFVFRNEAVKDEIKKRVKLSSLLSSYGIRNIKHNSGNGQGICSCPFHRDKKPSFSFNDDKGCYNCFSCGEKGDIFSFVMKTRGLNFKGAIEELKKQANFNNKKRRNYENRK